MELFSFDFKSIFVSLLLYFSGCQTATTFMSQDTGTSTFSLTQPKKETGVDYSKITTKLTLIILSQRDVFAYEGNRLSEGKIYSVDAIGQIIKRAQNKFSKNLVVLIKPTTKAGYNTTINILDEMSVNSVETYSIESLMPEESMMLKATGQ